MASSLPLGVTAPLKMPRADENRGHFQAGWRGFSRVAASFGVKRTKVGAERSCVTASPVAVSGDRVSLVLSIVIP
jgi:hypothetical protein